MAGWISPWLVGCFVLVLSISVPLGISAAQDSCPSSCSLPRCRCFDSEMHPDGLFQPKVPKFVVLSYQGPLTDEIDEALKILFMNSVNPSVNPYDCDIVGTLFVDVVGSNLNYVKEWYDRGFEIGITMSDKEWTQLGFDADVIKAKMEEILDKIEEGSGVPRKKIKGWRSPSIALKGNAQFQILSNLGMYDSTLVVAPGPGVWPFTLDKKFVECVQDNCPDSAFGKAGLWEVPITQHEASEGGSKVYVLDSGFRNNFIDMVVSRFNKYAHEFPRHPLYVAFDDTFLDDATANQLATLLSTFTGGTTNTGEIYVVSNELLLNWIRRPDPMEAGTPISTLYTGTCKGGAVIISPGRGVDGGASGEFNESTVDKWYMERIQEGKDEINRYHSADRATKYNMMYGVEVVPVEDDKTAFNAEPKSRQEKFEFYYGYRASTSSMTSFSLPACLAAVLFTLLSKTIVAM